jgi:hypothetical protein
MKQFFKPVALMLAWLGGIQSSPAPILLGALQVGILPPAAVTAGAHWQADGGALQTNGAVLQFASGSVHTVSFTSISGWAAPASFAVTILGAQTIVTNGTYLAAAPPVLAVSRTATNSVVVSWPSAFTGWNPQQTTNLAGTNWNTPAETVQDDGTNKFIIVSPAAGNVFYRLKNP